MPYVSSILNEVILATSRAGSIGPDSTRAPRCLTRVPFPQAKLYREHMTGPAVGFEVVRTDPAARLTQRHPRQPASSISEWTEPAQDWKLLDRPRLTSAPKQTPAPVSISKTRMAPPKYLSEESRRTWRPIRSRVRAEGGCLPLAPGGAGE